MIVWCRSAYKLSCKILFQKFEQELQGHQPIIEKVRATGDALVKAQHFASGPIRDKERELSKAWDELLYYSGDRKNKLDQSLQKQKVGGLWNSTLQVAFLCFIMFNGWMLSFRSACNIMTDIFCLKVLNWTCIDRSALLCFTMWFILQFHHWKDSTFSKVIRLYEVRKSPIDISENILYWLWQPFVCFQYLSEARDIESWINEKMQIVSSQDYGRDENGADKLHTRHKV